MRTLERLMTLNRMRKRWLGLGLDGRVQHRAPQRLLRFAGAGAIEPGLFKPYPAMQCALLDDFAFLPLYRELRRYGIEDARINAWLKAEETTGCRLAGHTVKELLPAFLANLPDMAAAQEYFLYYLGRSLSKHQLETVQENIRYVRGKYLPSLSTLDGSAARSASASLPAGVPSPLRKCRRACRCWPPRRWSQAFWINCTKRGCTSTAALPVCGCSRRWTRTALPGSGLH